MLRVVRWCWATLAFLVLLSAAALAIEEAADVRALGRIRTFFALRDENNLPNWWATVLLLGSAALCAMLSVNGEVVEKDTRRWVQLSATLVLMSLIEATQLRESLLRPAREVLNTSGVLYYPWVILGGIAVVAAIAHFLPFVRSQAPVLRNRIILSGAVYVFGALVLEMVGGEIVSSDRGDLAFVVVQELEEIAELTGLTLLVTGLLRALSESSIKLDLRPT